MCKKSQKQKQCWCATPVQNIHPYACARAVQQIRTNKLNEVNHSCLRAVTPPCTGASRPRGQVLSLWLAEEKEKVRKSELLPAPIFLLARHESSIYAKRFGLQAPEADPRFQLFQKGQPAKKNSFSGNDGIHKCRPENRRDLTCACESIAICCLTNLKGRLLSAPQ